MTLCVCVQVCVRVREKETASKSVCTCLSMHAIIEGEKNCDSSCGVEKSITAPLPGWTPLAVAPCPVQTWPGQREANGVPSGGAGLR